jgi:aerobic-type carbon monoxide dehydrogenase small subunit (CoxS/CutS family)
MGQVETATIELTLRVNGENRHVVLRRSHSLLEALRDGLKIISVREGCGIGMCGACTVLLDGRPVSSCLTLAVMATNHELTTVEGLGLDGELDLVQQAYVDSSGFQCSFCTPGFILTTKALLAEKPDATDGEIRDCLAGNLCRCGSYVKILDAVHTAMTRLRAASMS